MSPLNVAILWHMHQPDYRDPETGRLSMPWVRLHALKGYYDMLRVLERADENAHAVFNFVPSLVAQLNGYLEGTLTDTYLEISRKPTSELSGEERRFVAENFFHANRRSMIDCYPRYGELRTRAKLPTGAPRELPDDELRDLIVWFNLTWFGYSARKDFPFVRDLIRHGRKFSEVQKSQLIETQFAVMRAVLPAYRSAAERGQIELTATPFYHPILPLLCTTKAAEPGLPGRELPDPPFSSPEDARAHVSRAVALHEATFGQPPKGMWPAEGSVSPEAIRIFAEHGIEWVATDQDILFKSDGKLKPKDLYRPYRVGEPGGQVAVVFRNRDIADAIGFRYAAIPPDRAADDFMDKVRGVWQQLQGEKKPSLLTVVLDGENAWEYYPDGGEGFLTGMYRAVVKSRDFRWTTVHTFLEQNPPDRVIKKIFPGSWIGGNFDIWIGSDEENRAWAALRDARKALVAADTSLSDEARKQAWEHLYAAEGSDWFWWYGDDFLTALQGEFDRLFRARLAAIYHLIGQRVPRPILAPIKRGRAAAGSRSTDLVHPVIDGRSTDFYEWVGAGTFEATKAQSAMARVEQIVETIYYGADHRQAYFRIDTVKSPTDKALAGVSFIWEFPIRPDLRLTVGPLPGEAERIPMQLVDKDRTIPVEPAARVHTVVECAVPFLLLGFSPGSVCEFVLVVQRDEKELERWPRDGLLPLDVPSDTFELDHWTV